MKPTSVGFTSHPVDSPQKSTLSLVITFYRCRCGFFHPPVDHTQRNHTLLKKHPLQDSTLCNNICGRGPLDHTRREHTLLEKHPLVKYHLLIKAPILITYHSMHTLILRSLAYLKLFNNIIMLPGFTFLIFNEIKWLEFV